MKLKSAPFIGIGLISVALLCAGCQTTPTQAAPIVPVAQGPAGPPGQDGAQGQPGQQGATGDTGQTGSQGYTGDKGRPGDKGYTGDTGQKGDTGDRGKAAPCPDGQHRYTDPDNGSARCVRN